MAGTRIGIDTGGTFTDVVVHRRSTLQVHKLRSTPDDPARAVLQGLAAVRREGEEIDVVHGSTVGINAVLTGRLARTAFVTNAGFEDLIEIGRQARSSLYDLSAPKPVLPVPRELRFGVHSRRTAGGERLARPSRVELAALARRLRAARVEAVAVGLLHSYAHPADEHEILAALRSLDVPITCSADLLPVHGEYERFAAAILNAAMRPIMGSYLQRLTLGLGEGSLRLMRSSGGIMSAAEAAAYPARAAYSGPAGGVLAARQLARAMRVPRVATFDMGGTSTDVALVGMRASTAPSTTLASFPLALPSVEVHTVGCGGGSIAHVDAGGALRVGPQSAGADPGPACYGKSFEPTVTDAHMVLGHMGEQTLLSGAFVVDPRRSLEAVTRLARRLGLGVRRTAEGILEVAEINMLRALLVITVERAVDPARVPLVAFGGAGGLHAASMARRLSMPVAVVPRDPGAFSALGLALAAPSHETILPVLRDVDALAPRMLQAMARDLAAQTLRALQLGAGPRAKGNTIVEAWLRFRGQGQSLCVPFRLPMAPAFHALHRRLFGFVPSETPVELVELRARSEGTLRRAPSRTQDHALPRRLAPLQQRRPLAGGSPLAVHVRDGLPRGVVISGPCLIEEFSGVTVVPAGVRCEVRSTGLLLRPDPVPEKRRPEGVSRT